MTNPRVCVIAVDGSDDSEYALHWYSKHVHKVDDKAVLVFVPEHHGLLHASRWENTVYALNRDLPESMSDGEQDQIKSELLKFAEKLLNLGIAGKVKNVLAAKPEEGILRVAEEESADMIVVGSRGRGAFHRTFVGSICDHLVHHSHCAVVVCKRPPKGAPELYPEEPKC
ncbi:unnamed protein product [Candidula unifasciata]|uniref:UspA domain-containing protein n=1 Tax=Candidula unifasciata TaxID=100452 RepID=A0A8S3ZN34_9EUPU|nr:unnamed protein product [Candidula unifasciata]